MGKKRKTPNVANAEERRLLEDPIFGKEDEVHLKATIIHNGKPCLSFVNVTDEQYRARCQAANKPPKQKPF